MNHFDTTALKVLRVAAGSPAEVCRRMRKVFGDDRVSEAAARGALCRLAKKGLAERDGDTFTAIKVVAVA